jgi:uncharacterized protein YkwD
VLLAVVVSAFGAADASASFSVAGTPTTGPDQAIQDLVAGAGRLHALVLHALASGQTGGWRMSSDGGASWIDVVPDGMTDVNTLSGSAGRVAAFGSAGGGAAFAVLEPGAPSPSPTVSISGPEPYTRALGGLLLDGGRMMVVLRRSTSGNPVLADVGADGVVAASWEIPFSRGSFEVVQGVDGAISAGADGSRWFTLHAGQSPVEDPGGPLWLDLGGGTAVRSEVETINGVAMGDKSGLTPVQGTDLWQLARGVGSSNGRPLLRMWQGFLLAATQMEPPQDARVVADGGRLFAARLSFGARGATPDETTVWTAPIDPPSATANGAVSPVAQQMVAQANALRADDGLPPLIADELISRASENHSRYYTLNTEPNSLAAHSEVPGTPGFTGEGPGERCAAVGATCGSEILYPALGGVEAVRGWMATIFHRSLIGSAEATVVGAAKVGSGPAVMNGRGGSGRLLTPHAMPLGAWNGPLSFAGEIPDPAASCASLGQPRITAPFGTAITVEIPSSEFAPSGGVTSIALREAASGRDLPGCLLSSGFVPDDPLKAHTTYAATAQWQLADAPQPPYSWTFTTGADDATAGASTAATTGAKARSLDVRVGTRARRNRSGSQLAVIVIRGAAIGRVATFRARRLRDGCHPRCARRLVGEPRTGTVRLTATTRVRLPKRRSGDAGWRFSVRISGFTVRGVRYRQYNQARFVRKAR